MRSKLLCNVEWLMDRCRAQVVHSQTRRLTIDVISRS